MSKQMIDEENTKETIVNEIPKPVQKTEAEMAVIMKHADGLKRLVNIPTITNSGDEMFSLLRDVMEDMFPLVHEHLEKKILGGNALLFKWKGKSDKKPIVLMGHQDVVPVDEDGWTKPPFGGVIEDGKIYGRGTMDCKNCLYMNLATIEELLNEGYTPENDVYVIASDNEETMGNGTPSVVEYLKSENIKPFLVIDEGGAFIPEPLKGMKGTFAMIGVLEKGYGDFKFTAKSNGGHASTPPKNTPVARLSKFITEVEKGKIFKKYMNDQVVAMLEALSEGMQGPQKFLLGHTKAFKPLLTKLLPKLAPGFGDALLSTTCVFTQTHASDASNVIPAEAYAVANLRFAPHQGHEACLKALQEVADKYDITVEIIQAHDAYPAIDTNNDGYKFLTDTIKKVHPNYGIVPYLIMVGTDSRHLQEISDCVLRFTPMVYTNEQRGRIHGNDENLSIDTLADSIRFMKKLIRDNK